MGRLHRLSVSLGLQCAPAHKLYALYLVDSIVKNIGVLYTTLFAGNMPEVWRSWHALHVVVVVLRQLRM